MTTLREKVGQLFIVRPESLEPAIRYDDDAQLPPYRLQAVSDGMRRRAEEYPVGGILLYGHNILDEKQLNKFVTDLKALPGAPLLCIDEEGGRVSRIAGNPAFDQPAPVAQGFTGSTLTVPAPTDGKLYVRLRDAQGAMLVVQAPSPAA